MFRYDMISSLHFKFIMKLLGQSDSCGAMESELRVAVNQLNWTLHCVPRFPENMRKFTKGRQGSCELK